jgi:hypothetical protein
VRPGAPRALVALCARAALLAVALAIAAACGGSSAKTGTPDFPKVVPLGKGEIFPSIVNQSLAVGPNRVSIKLINRDDQPVLGAAVHLRFYDLNGYDLTGAKPVFSSEADARFIPVELSYIDEQSPGKERSAAGSDGVYVASASFGAPGDWGVQIAITSDSEAIDPIPYRFTVLDHTTEPGIGDAAPPSMQQTLATATSIEEIDSSYPPRPAMHEMTLADAVASGRPTVVAFATPAFCRSRTCAPVMDTVMDPLYAKYGDRSKTRRGEANFIHIEPYDLRQLRQANIQEPVPATREWKLQSEPWVFVIDRRGRIAARFEGIMAADEVEAALQQALAP